MDTPSDGLAFGAPTNESGFPSYNLQALIDAANNPVIATSYWTARDKMKTKVMELMKFEDVASDSTRRVIINARKEPTPMVYPEDFPMVSDFEFILFHQVTPFKPSAPALLQRKILDAEPSSLLKQNGLDEDSGSYNKLFGFCCKHCARAGQRKNHFPVDLNTLADASFLQRMQTHFMKCAHVNQEIKDAFDELKRLTSEQGARSKRGSKKRFLQKIWGRLRTHYGVKSGLSLSRKGK